VGQVSELLPEPSPAQEILKRLIEAEDQARSVVEAAQESAQATIAEAERQAAAGVLRSRLEEAEAQGAAEAKRRLEEAEAQAQEFELRAAAHFSGAVELVVDWVAGGGN
jgi:vacuolar-type H+-ATPase subunit H